jgi:hypothetical protein
MNPPPNESLCMVMPGWRFAAIALPLKAIIPLMCRRNKLLLTRVGAQFGLSSVASSRAEPLFRRSEGSP